MNIEEGNRLIAEFMQGKEVSYSKDLKVWDIPNMDGYQFVLFYHSSWDWLMPVLEKIVRENDDIVIDVCIGDDTTFYNKDRTGGSVFRQTGTLDNTWRACVYFIQKQNENTSSLQP